MSDIVRNIYDFDGVVSEGLHPEKKDIIITGRCIGEADVVYKYLLENVGYLVPIYFNPIEYEVRGDHSWRSRIISGAHKGRTIGQLSNNLVKIGKIYEDDKVQIKEMKKWLKKSLGESIIHIESSVEK